MPEDASVCSVSSDLENSVFDLIIYIWIHAEDERCRCRFFLSAFLEREESIFLTRLIKPAAFNFSCSPCFRIAWEGRLVDVDSMAIDGAVETTWEPLSSVDYFVLGFVGVMDMLALLICAHLLWYRKWPPYVTKNVNLVVIAVSWYQSSNWRQLYGFIRRVVLASFEIGAFLVRSFFFKQCT